MRARARWPLEPRLARLEARLASGEPPSQAVAEIGATEDERAVLAEASRLDLEVRGLRILSAEAESSRLLGAMVAASFAILLVFLVLPPAGWPRPPRPLGLAIALAPLGIGGPALARLRRVEAELAASRGRLAWLILRIEALRLGGRVRPLWTLTMLVVLGVQIARLVGRG